ncbi:helix-turn-helix domain-containing protein [Exiguobacterium sp. AT1b]|uniref:Transcriptional regulator, XRE family n=1 Tax=Exiguobacterium sp. (strain ATCC BAA-1283 / AT1b) TaxID=360911 RepID=C4L6R5_EXISA|nr:helix-turn-helix transcriptional regulator [Exiguobacterium sp. AT1b]ACQ71944.1 transcriptional regulator, XRE family [Exiguobacterium sp. AT1b]
MLKFGDLLKQLRKEKKLTQKELAEDLELDQSSISNYESNKKLPDVDTMMKMAIVFDVPVQELINARNYTAHGIQPNGSYGITWADRVSENSRESDRVWQLKNSTYNVRKFNENELKNIKWEVDGQEVTPEEVEEAIKYIKFQRTLRDKDK